MGKVSVFVDVPFLFNMTDVAVLVLLTVPFLFNMSGRAVYVFVDSAFFIQYARWDAPTTVYGVQSSSLS
jgi:hypothetical protein